MPTWLFDGDDFGIPFVPPPQSPPAETATGLLHDADRAAEKHPTPGLSPPPPAIAAERHTPVTSSQQTSILAPDPSRLVWVKIPGFPQWPGLCASLEDVPLNKFHEVHKAQRPGCQLIYTLGDHMYVWAKSAQITTWACPHFETLVQKGSSKHVFQRAVNEARELTTDLPSPSQAVTALPDASSSQSDLHTGGADYQESDEGPELSEESSEFDEVPTEHERWRRSNAQGKRKLAKCRGQAARKKEATTQWDALQRRKWRPPAQMYAASLHNDLRAVARKRLEEAPNYAAHSVRSELTSQQKLLPSDGEERVDKRIAALLVAEIIPPCAAAQLCAKPLSELRPELVIFSIETAMGNLSPAGITQSVNAFLKFWQWLDQHDIPFEKVSRLDIERYLAHVHQMATGTPVFPQDQPSASVLLDVSTQHADQQEGEARSDDEEDDTAAFLDQWTGYSAANAQRSLLARLEKHFFFPVHALEAKSPQVGQGARIQPPKRHATPTSPDVLRAVQTYAECASTPDIMANVAAAFLVSALGARRARQLQHVFFYAEGEEVAGARTKKEGRKGKRQV